MEALTLRSFPLRAKNRSPERELQDLRPLGEAYLVRRFGNSLNRADAEDAVADVVIRLHKRIESGRAPDNLRAAFFTSVRNAAIDQLRARNARPTVALEAVADAAAEDVSPVERAEGHEDSVRLQEALARMRGNYRETILLRFGVGMTVPEIAERLEISLPAAKKLVLRATEQARKRLAAIEGADFCPEMQDLARRAVLDKEAAGLAEESEQRILRAHVSHCGSCKTFLAELHRNLHELGGTMLLAGTGGAGVEHRLGIADHLSRWFAHASDSAQAAGSRVRLAAFKATGAFQGGDSATAGALGSTAQKVVAVCGAGAATTACLATGIVGPGVGGFGVDHSGPEHPPSPTPIEKTIAEEPSAPVVSAPPEVEPEPSAPAPTAGSPAPADEKNATETTPAASEPQPSEAASEEFGFESSAPPAAEAAPAPEPATSAPPTTSAPSAPTGGGGGGGGGEKFGFSG
jgi:RNA polymerase sigma factor (sigma-70 family)